MRIPVQLLLALTASTLLTPVVAAAQTPSLTFTLADALEYADEHYPSIQAARAQTEAATDEALAAHGVYRPRLDAIWQTNRGTANNVFGQVLPQSVVPAISGPVLASPSSQSIWGSLTGALLTWEPFDLGLRKATVGVAEAAVDRARATEALRRLDVQAAAGAAFLTVVASDGALAAARADLNRRETLATAVRTLAENQLRAGAEAWRADAEPGAATTRVLQAQRILSIARAAFARSLGLTRGAIDIDSRALTSGALLPSPIPAEKTEHPSEAVHRAAVEAARAEERVLAHSDLPRVYLQSSAFARGTGGHADGSLDGGADGLGLERANWAAGVQIVFPNVFDLSTLRARKAAAAASTRAESARLTEAELLLAEQRDVAHTMVQAAESIAQITPTQLAAAQQSHEQASARYRAGLANLTEVVEAQSLLAQAEYEDQLARVEVWRARLAEAIADGNLAPLIRLLRPARP